MSKDIVFHVSKPAEKQYKPIYVYLEVANSSWEFRYKKKEELIVMSGSEAKNANEKSANDNKTEENDLEGVYFKALIECLNHFKTTHRPIVVYTSNPYFKTCIKEWFNKWSSDGFKNRPYKELFLQLLPLIQNIKLDIILEHKISEKCKI